MTRGLCWRGHPMPDTHRCPQCATELPADAPEGVCPKCLLGLGFDSQPTTDGAGSRSAEAQAAPQGPAATTPFTPRRGFVPPLAGDLATLFPQPEIVEL